MNKRPHQLEDGAHEVVDVRPLRPERSVVDLETIAAAKPGGRMAEVREAGDRARREFVLIRTPADVVKIALTHIPTYRAMVRAWTAKRVAGAEDPGVSAAEIAEAMGVAPSAIKTHITSLVRNRCARAKTTVVGFQGVRSVYYPSDLGATALAMAEVLGKGASVQVGAPANAWRGRNQTEPSTVFQFANLIRRGIAKET